MSLRIGRKARRRASVLGALCVAVAALGGGLESSSASSGIENAVAADESGEIAESGGSGVLGGTGNLASFEAGFETPPPGFGEIPFWWWTGEKLDVDRLCRQVDELARKGISGVQVNYAHQDVRSDAQPNWLTYPNEPEVFTDEWFDAFEKVAARCRERKMGIGLSGYTLDWQNSPTNLYDRIIYRDKETQSRTLYVAAKERVAAGAPFRLNAEIVKNSDADDALVRIVAYPLDANGRLDAQNGEDFLPTVDDSGNAGAADAEIAPNAENSESAEIAENVEIDENVENAEITEIAQVDREVWYFKAKRVPQTLNPLHPDSGRKVVERFFQPFEDRAKVAVGDSAAANANLGLNYFFQDELQIGTGDLTWADDVPDEFARRKGYSVWAALPAKFGADVGPLAEKYRLDYSRVRVELAEERYFRPIFDWHSSRGLIYACDSGGRGKDPNEFGDYFSAVRWYTAPGHDTPGGKADFIKNKVSSSIAHFYGRPRVWLEGYHSFGWGATPEQLFFATNENFLFGANLLNLHGLYYTTYGGFWEWAPPCYHFRQPYWETFGSFLKYFERLSFALTRGVEQTDFVVLYPVSPFQSGTNGPRARDVAFEAATRIFESGRDVLFIDDDSLARAEIRDGRLAVAGAEHRVLVLPSIQGVRRSTLQKALDFYRAGGVVVALDSLPFASDAAGRDDPALEAAVRELFGAVSADESKPGVGVSTVRTNGNGGLGAFVSGNLLDATVQTGTASNGKAGGASNGKTGGVDGANDSNETDEANADARAELAADGVTVAKVRKYPGGFAGRWVWSPEPKREIFLKWVASGLSDEPTEYGVKFFCDNADALFVGDRRLCENADYSNGWTGTATLKNGDVLTIDARDADEPRRGSAGVFVALVKDGKTVATAEDFRFSLVDPNSDDAAQNWRTNADDFADLAAVDVGNVHVLHRTGVNSEATAQNGRNGADGKNKSDAALWERFGAFLERFPRDVFAVKTGKPCGVMRRSAPDFDLFFLMRAEKGASLTFRATGKVEIWNPWDGSRREVVDAVSPTDGPNAGTTTFRWPFEADEAGLVVFLKNERPTNALAALETDVDEIAELGPTADGNWAARAFASTAGPKTIRATTADGQTRTLAGVAPEATAPIALGGDREWSFELSPTLDDRDGDFRLPVSEEKIGAEARRLERVVGGLNGDSNGGGSARDGETSEKSENAQNGEAVEPALCDFGQRFWRLGPFPKGVDVAALDARLAALRTIDPKTPVVVDGREYRWAPLGFSWRWGIEGNPGHQGYHGLKEHIDSRFIGLGKTAEALNETVFVPEDGGETYYLWTTVAVERASDAETGSGSDGGAAIPVDVWVGGDAPSAFFVDGTRVEFDGGESATPLVVAPDGKSRPTLLRYDSAGRRSCVFVARGANDPTGPTRLVVENGSDGGALCDGSTAAGNRRTPLSTVWFDRPGVVEFDPIGVEGGTESTGAESGAKDDSATVRRTERFRFVAPPGLREMRIPVRGALTAVFVDGEKAPCRVESVDVAGADFWRGKRDGEPVESRGTLGGEPLSDSANVFAAPSDRTIRWTTVRFEFAADRVADRAAADSDDERSDENRGAFERAATVELVVEPVAGAVGGAVFPEPIRLICGRGTTTLGDWNERGTLADYSGGAKYAISFDWETGANGEESANGGNGAGDGKSTGERTTLDLGKVGASCRVSLNGKMLGDLTTAPWRIELGGALRPGENRLEIDVFNTLSNHYSVIPSRYKGSAPSGLIGPVEIRRERAFELRETNASDASARNER